MVSGAADRGQIAGIARHKGVGVVDEAEDAVGGVGAENAERAAVDRQVAGAGHGHRELQHAGIDGCAARPGGDAGHDQRRRARLDQRNWHVGVGLLTLDVLVLPIVVAHVENGAFGVGGADNLDHVLQGAAVQGERPAAADINDAGAVRLRAAGVAGVTVAAHVEHAAVEGQRPLGARYCAPSWANTSPIMMPE